MNAQAIEFHYMALVFPLLREVLEEAMILGIVVVAFGMLRRAAQDPGQLVRATFWQRVILLFLIMIWTSSVILNYQLYQQSLAGQNTPLTPAEALAFARMTLAMIPLELSTGVLISGMFGALAFKDYRRTGESLNNMRLELTILPLIGMVTHFVYALWFVAISFFTGRLSFSISGIDPSETIAKVGTTAPAEMSAIDNIALHLGLVWIYFMVLALWRAVTAMSLYKARPVVFDWMWTALYGSIILSLYIFRLGQYLTTYKA